METLAVTTMTTRGQIVIPQAVREALDIDAGTKFAVAGEGDTIILKRLEIPSTHELKSLLAESRKAARKKKLKKSDMAKAIREERKKG